MKTSFPAIRRRPSFSRARLAVLAVAATGFIAPLSAHAQQRQAGRAQSVLDRNKVPEPGPTPVLRVPEWTRTRLPNGAELIVSQKRNLPLVSVSVDFIGGSNQFEDTSKTGVGSITAQMLSEGTTSRTGDDLANAQQSLGTEISVSVSGESGRIGFSALSSKLAPALELAADMLVNPSFPADALERLRAQRLVQLTQARDQPNSIANNVFSKVVYGDEHPYGRVMTEQSTKSITRDDVVAFHRTFFRPGRAIVTVVGDVNPDTVRATIERTFASWTPGGERPSFAYPRTPPARTRTIYLVDKPKAAQSVVAIGLPGPARDTPDYYAIEVMNTILGDLFQSRLNHLIREVRGYSYGVGSRFGFGKGPGAFRAGGAIVTAKTDSAMIDFMNELRGVQGDKPFTEDEIKQGKESLIQSLPARFASVNAVASAISGIYVQALPETYYQEYAAKVNAVTPDDMVRVARNYIDLDNINIVVVGDRAVIEEPLRRLNLGPIVYLDVEGKPISAVTP